MSKTSEPPGCRSAAFATGLLVVLAIVFMAIGLTLVNQTSCDGACETLGFTLLYAGLPVSGVFGVLFGDLVVAWPLDITMWVVAGFLIARYSDNRERNAVGMAVLGVGIALIYGLVLSQFVEIAI